MTGCPTWSTRRSPRRRVPACDPGRREAAGAFFGYPGKPSLPHAPTAARCTCSRGRSRTREALAWLADELGAAAARCRRRAAAQPADGAIDARAMAAASAALLPENCIVAEDAVTSGRGFFPAAPRRAAARLAADHRRRDRPRPAVATGAAIGAPDARWSCLQADGSGMYTLQALWTQAREKLDVTTSSSPTASTRSCYGELAVVGANQAARRWTCSIWPTRISTGSPWPGMGVEATRWTLGAVADLLPRNPPSGRGRFLSNSRCRARGAGMC